MVGELALSINGTAIADGDPLSLGVVERWEPDGQRAIDPSIRIRSSAPVFFDRLTYAERLRFSIVRLHASVRAALTHELTHGRGLPGTAELLITLIEGGVTWRARCPGCAIERHTPRRTGPLTEFLYDLAFSETIEITEDAAALDYLDAGAYAGTTYGPAFGIIDGGHYLDSGFPAELEIDAGSYA